MKKNRKILNCAFCNKTIERRPSSILGDNVYCSHECYSEDRKKRVIVECENCHKSLVRLEWLFNQSKTKQFFCNIKCMAEFRSGERNHTWKGGRKSIKCEVCGTEIKRKLFHVKLNNHNFCSNECHGLFMHGKNNPAWVGGGKSQLYCPSWIDAEYKRGILERDGFKCLNPACLKVTNRLALHHINYNKKDCSPKNIITLCYSCNGRANTERKWFQSWYSGILANRYGYSYG